MLCLQGQVISQIRDRLFLPNESRILVKLDSSETLNERLTSGACKKQAVNKLHGILEIIQAICARTGN